MKIALFVILGCMMILFNNTVFASCGSGGCTRSCNPYETTCQCTDPSCNSRFDGDCLSRSECCEAFGNIGSR